MRDAQTAPTDFGESAPSRATGSERPHSAFCESSQPAEHRTGCAPCWCTPERASGHHVVPHSLLFNVTPFYYGSVGFFIFILFYLMLFISFSMKGKICSMKKVEKKKTKHPQSIVIFFLSFHFTKCVRQISELEDMFYMYIYIYACVSRYRCHFEHRTGACIIHIRLNTLHYIQRTVPITISSGDDTLRSFTHADAPRGAKE